MIPYKAAYKQDVFSIVLGIRDKLWEVHKLSFTTYGFSVAVNVTCNDHKFRDWFSIVGMGLIQMTL